MKRHIISFVFICFITSIFSQPIVNNRVLMSWPNASGEIVIGDTIVAISNNAFYNNINITSVNIPLSVNAIGYGSFYGCTNLKSILNADSIKSIDAAAFYNCISLDSINIGRMRISSISNNLFFNCKSLKSITIPNTVTIINGSAFMGCSGLTSVQIANSVQTISDYAFSNCSSLAEVKIGDKSSELKNKNILVYASAFNNCPITTVEMNKNIINDYSGYSFLRNKTTLTNVIIGDSVTTLTNNQFYGCNGLNSINIPRCISKIGSYPMNVFTGCSNLTNIEVDNLNPYFFAKDKVLFNKMQTKLLWATVNMSGNYVVPASVDTIADYAFSGIKNNFSITIPGNVKRINPYAFKDNSGLSSMSFGDKMNETDVPINIDITALTNCSNLKVLNLYRPFVHVDESSVFSNLPALDSLTLGNKVMVLHRMAFSNSKNLRSITIGNEYSLKTDTIGINVYAFNNSGNIRNLYMNKKITLKNTNGYSTFSTLTNVKVGNTVTAIGTSLFDGCTNLTTVILPNSVKTIENMAFSSCSNLSKVALSDSIISIGSSCFNYCVKLDSIVLPTKLKEVSYGLFYNCSALKMVVLGNSIKSINESAFEGCSSLTDVQFTSSLTTLGYRAFANCVKIASIDLPNSVTTLSSFAFSGCKGLKTVHFGSSLKRITQNTFENCTALNSLMIPNNINYIEGNAFLNCTGMKELTLGEFDNTNPILFNFDTYPFPGCGIVTLNQNRNVFDMQIGSPFIRLTSLKKINFGPQVTYLAVNSFNGCSALDSVNIPETIKSIGGGSFWNCSSLKSINFPQSITTIAPQLFWSCTSLESFKVPDQITSIGGYAFADCKNLKKLEIPKGVTSIDAVAFSGCFGLREMYVHNPIPPTTGVSCFYGTQKTIVILYVPKGSKTTYQLASQWNEFTNIVEMDETAINTIEDTNFISFTNGSIIIIPKNNEQTLVYLINSKGQIIWSERTNSKINLSLTGFAHGLYIVKAGTLTKKIML